EAPAPSPFLPILPPRIDRTVVVAGGASMAREMVKIALTTISPYEIISGRMDGRGRVYEGFKIMSIFDVADLARVSSSTVSRVINNHPRVAPETAQSVRKAMKTLGYTPSERRPGPK